MQRQEIHSEALMFNINLLGAPGIQPESVDESISFRNANYTITKPLNKLQQPGVVTKFTEFIKSKGDWLAFLLISTVLIYVLDPGSSFLGLEKKSRSMEDQLILNIETITEVLKQLEQIPSTMSIQELITNKDVIRLKLISQSQDELFSIANGLRLYTDGLSRINGDSTSVFRLSFESTWGIPVNAQKEDIPQVNTSGDIQFILVAIQKLIEDNQINYGSLEIELVDTDLYQMTFIPVGQ